MATVKAKGSIILEILIVLLIAALIGTIIYPKRVWQEAEQNTEICRANMDRILKAELIYLKYHNTYQDTLEKVFSFIEDDTTSTLSMEYIYADSTLAEKMLELLEAKFQAADSQIENFLADTLLYTVLETSKYDSNMAKVILKRYELLPTFADSVKRLESSDSSYVWMLKEIAGTFDALALTTPLREDDSLKLVMKRIQPEISTATLVDSLYQNVTWAGIIDSAVSATLRAVAVCPSNQHPYKIAVDDTSVIKKVDIMCPIDAEEIEASKADFMKYTIGHLRLVNHGNIKAGEKSWLQ